MKRDPLGTLVGLLTFAGGVALLLFTFRLALDMFGTPPAQALNLEKGKPLDVNATGAAAGGIIIRILLLLVMAFVGSLIANRGVQLIAHTGPKRAPKNDPPAES